MLWTLPDVPRILPDIILAWPCQLTLDVWLILYLTALSFCYPPYHFARRSSHENEHTPYHRILAGQSGTSGKLEARFSAGVSTRYKRFVG